MKQTYIGLGSNIEPRKNYLVEAIHLLNSQKAISVLQQSSIYETNPVDYTEQADFLNMVIKTETSLSPPSLLDTCQLVEQQLNRERKIDKGPRTIDLDILLYGNEPIHLENLEVPHPRLKERAFVLVPLYEIAPKQELPDSGQTVTFLYNQLSQDDLNGVKKWE